MDLLTAISVRHSRRHYIDEPMTSILCDKLRAESDRLNAESGLDMRLVTDRHELFKGGFGLFQGARNAFLLAGAADDPDLDEKCGYWGERLALFAATMNLGACWVAATFNRALAETLIPAGERLVCAIAAGLVRDDMGVREGIQYRLIHRSCKPVGALCRYDRYSERFMAGHGGCAARALGDEPPAGVFRAEERRGDCARVALGLGDGRSGDRQGAFRAGRRPRALGVGQRRGL